MSGETAGWWAAALGVLAVSLVVAPGPVEAARRVTASRASPGRPRPDGATRWPLLAGVAGGLVVTAVAPGPGGLLAGLTLAVGTAVLLPRWLARRGRAAHDPLSEAGAWDQLAACLRAGLPLDRAVRAVAPALPEAAGGALRRVADLVALGADPVAAWEPALEVPATTRLARAARRSARSGAAVADVATTVADDVRGEAADAVSARAERAGVLVTGPLGLCFLPAFLALGIVPVVVGLAGPLLDQR